MTHPVAGVFSASFTAIGPDGSVDPERTAAHARFLLDEGCDGIALLGTTGEANSLSMAERKGVLEAAVEAGVPADRLVPGTGLCSVPETVELTRHARSCGVGAVLLLPPFYYPAPSEAGLIDHFSRVLDRCAGDGLQVLLYNIPQMTGIPIGHGLIAALRERFAGVLVGVKDSSGDLSHMLGLVSAFPDLAVFAGADHLMGPLLRGGGAGCITATSNLIAPLLADLYARLRRGESSEATEALEDRIAAIRALFQRWPQIPALKAANGLMTGDKIWAAVRPPMLPLDAAQTAEMAAAMAELDLFPKQRVEESLWG